MRIGSESNADLSSIAFIITMEMTKNSHRPPPVFNPDLTAATPPPSPAPTTSAETNAPAKVKPYHGSCPHCEHGSMFPLVRFLESDVNENPTADAIMPNKMGARLFPGLSFAIMMISWIGGITWDKNRVARGRIKVRKARAEVLPRSPQAVICPNCYEVLERM